MKLTELIRISPEPIACEHVDASLTITSITADSRAVKPGSIFVALQGSKSDGVVFVPQAIKAGAVAILYASDASVNAADAAILRAANPRRALAHIASALYARQPEHIIAVTGTDGKTSTCDFYRRIWHALGKQSASIGTLGILRGENEILQPESQTTPPPELLHQLFAELADKKIEYLGMEASSHGLDQYRLDGVKLQAAAFTNIARDHLDYHLTEEAYFQAKARLFSEVLPAGATAVLNQDDKKFSALRDMCKSRNIKVVGFGNSGEQFAVRNIEPLAHGQRVAAEIYGKPHSLYVPMVGAFQVFNIMAALALVEATGGHLAQALSVVPELKGVPGRMEHVATLENGATVFVDYAHTPLALANVLTTVRPHVQHKLHVVFGCGGDRDKGKRPQMGEVANRLADYAIITDDNPRSENPATIRAEILAACSRGKEVADRKEAIYVALGQLRAGDVLVIAGKGHEKVQMIAGTSHPFDDANVAKEGVKALGL